MPSLATGLSDKKWSAVQNKDTMYLHNITDGFRKYNGSTVSVITPAAAAPSAPTYNAAVVGSLTDSKTYRWRLTFINASLGIESEGSVELSRLLGAAETGAKLNLPSITAPYDKIRVYRTVADGQSFFLEGDTSSTTFNSTAGDVTLGITLDTTIDVLSTLPLGNYIGIYKGFLLVIGPNVINFCRVVASDSDTYWLATDKFEISSKFGATSGYGTVGNTAVVFTPTSIHGFSGSTATEFKFTKLKEGIGCSSHNTIDYTSDGNLIMFAGTKGVAVIKENDITKLTETDRTVDVQFISSPSLDPVFQGKDEDIKLNPTDYPDARGYMDIDENTYHLYVSGYHFSFNLENGTINHEKNIDVYHALYVKTGIQATGAYVTNKQGFLLREDISYTNLAPNGTVTGNPTSATRTTMTASGAIFDTIGDGLKGAYITVDHDTFIESRQIKSNTGTVITTIAPWDLIPSANDTYYIGYTQCTVLTKEYKLTDNINEIVRNYYLGLIHEKSPETQNMIIKWFVDRAVAPVDSFVLDMSVNLWDKITVPARGRLLQLYLFTHYNKKKYREGTPLNISSYIFFSSPKGNF